MKKSWFRPLIPHAIAVGVFLIVALVYCSPVLEHKTLSPRDTAGWKAMAQNSFEYKATHGHFPLWTEGLYSGMPGYQIAMDAPSYSPQYFIYRILTLGLPNPAALFFLASICFYFLALSLGVNPYVGIITGLAYAYSTYNPSIVVVGHSTKMQAIAVMPAFFAGLIWLYDKKYLLGVTTVALFTALFIAANHPQVVYYALLAAGIMTLAYLVRWIRNKDYKHIGRIAVLGPTAAIIGIASNAVVTLTTLDYSKASLRDGSELTVPGGSVTKTAISQDYPLSYSTYKTESFTLLVPKMFGGSDIDPQMTADDSKTMTALQSFPPQVAQQISGAVRSYRGGIGTTAGPAYAGAIICLFALVGIFVLDGKHKWWMLAASIFLLMISWGEYLAGFNGFLLHVLPGMNKFRAPSLAIVIPSFLLVTLAALTLDRLVKMPAENRDATWKKYKKGLSLVGGIFVLLFLIYNSSDYSAPSDIRVQQATAAWPQQAQELISTFVHAMREDRQAFFLDSLLRSLGYIAVAASIGFLWIKGKLKPMLALGIIGALTLIDLFTIDVQYLSADKYVDNEDAATPFQPSPTETCILADKSYYRVFDLRDGIGNITNEGAASYFYRNIAGYNPAKLSIYQDLIENQLYKYPNCQPTLDMLNTKYIIGTGPDERDSITVNPGALGAAWLIHGARFCDSARAVMDALTTLHVKDSAVFFTADKAVIAPTAFGTAANGDTVYLTKNDNDEMTYQSKTATPRFAVFSEVFYNRGWRAYVDDKETPIIRSNYVLRGLALPAGNHIIRFEFRPASYYSGATIQRIAGVFLLALLILTGIQARRTER